MESSENPFNFLYCNQVGLIWDDNKNIVRVKLQICHTTIVAYFFMDKQCFERTWLREGKNNNNKNPT